MFLIRFCENYFLQDKILQEIQFLQVSLLNENYYKLHLYSHSF